TAAHDSGRGDDRRPDPRRPRADRLRDRVGLRLELLQPAPVRPRQARRAHLLRCRGRVWRGRDAGELLLERRPSRLTTVSLRAFGREVVVMGVCDIPVISTVCDTAGEAAASLISAPFDWLAEALGGAAGWLIETMWSVFDSTTLVDLTGDGYTSVYNLVFGIAVFVTLLFFCF